MSSDRFVVDTIIEFIGEHKGRRLLFDWFCTGPVLLQDGRIHVQHVYNKLNTMLGRGRDRMTTSKPYLVQIVHESHYSGIRIEKNHDESFKVYVLDSNEDNQMYASLPADVLATIRDMFHVETVNRLSYTIQQTMDDTFCQTWSIILLAQPNIILPVDSVAKMAYILAIYKRVALSRHFDEWLSRYRETQDLTLIKSLSSWNLTRFRRAIGGTRYI